MTDEEISQSMAGEDMPFCRHMLAARLAGPENRKFEIIGIIGYRKGRRAC